MRVNTTSVRLSAEGVKKIRAVAEVHGMTVRQYLEALMHYGLSQWERPGSWEAQIFDPGNYQPGTDKNGFPLGFADRWFK